MYEFCIVQGVVIPSKPVKLGVMRHMDLFSSKDLRILRSSSLLTGDIVFEGSAPKSLGIVPRQEEINTLVSGCFRHFLVRKLSRYIHQKILSFEPISLATWELQAGL